MEKIHSVLLLGSDDFTTSRYNDLLTKNNLAFNVLQAKNNREAISFLLEHMHVNESKAPELIIIDQSGDMEGSEFTDIMDNIYIENKSKVRIIILSYVEGEKTVETVGNRFKIQFLTKPCTEEVILEALDSF